MHTLLDTFAVQNGINNKWQQLSETTLQTLTVKNAMNLYRRFYIKLQAGSAPAFWADLKTISATETINTVVLKDWLLTQTSYNFTTIIDPVINQKAAQYSMAAQAGYVANTWDKTYGLNNPEPTRKDLLMTRQIVNTKYSDYHKYCLTTVGGLFHYTNVQYSGLNEQGVVIEEAMNTVRNSSVPAIGVLSFSKVCTIEKLKITYDMISKLTDPLNGSYDITKSLILTLPYNITDKSIMLVIAGHLCTEQPLTFTKIADNKLLLNLNIDDAMIDRYYCANSILNLSNINTLINPTGKMYVPKANILSEAALKAILTMSQSFIVVLNNPNVYVQKSEGMRSVSRVQYIVPVKPTTLVYGLQGYCPEYWLSQEKFGYSIRLASPRKYIIQNNITDPTLATHTEQLNVMPDKVDYDNYLFRQDKQYLSLLEIGSDSANP